MPSRREASNTAYSEKDRKHLSLEQPVVSMIFSVDRESGELHHVPEEEFADLDVLEQRDFEEWAIRDPRVLGEELLIVSNQYSNFDQTRDRLDILALDKDGKLVVVELKRDRADKTTDLQAIKYAGYCSTLTAEDVQKEYREFWNRRENGSLTPENVGEKFDDFLGERIEDIVTTDEGWAEFDLDDRPRVLLVAGEFGIEVTAPVMWLIEEYNLDVTCVRVRAHEHEGQILLNSQQVIPVTEAEEFMTRRREKQERQSTGGRRRAAVKVLLERNVLEPGDTVVFNDGRKPPESEWLIDPPDEFWSATVTGNTGQADNVRWEYDGQTYSFTGVTKQLLDELVGRDQERALNGYKYWCHPAFGSRTLSALRNSEAENSDRRI